MTFSRENKALLYIKSQIQSISVVQMAVWMNFVRCGYFKNECGDPTF